MGFLCDFCGKGVSNDHKMACERCYNLFLHLLAAFEGAKKREKRTYKKRKTKRKKKKRAILSASVKTKAKAEKTERKPEKTERKPEKTEREILFEKDASKKSDSADLLTKCAVCEFGFLDGQTKKISCIDGKDPQTCGK